MVTTALAPHHTALSEAPAAEEAGHHTTPWPAEERILLGRVAVQDPQAFALLYTRYAPPVRRYLRRRLQPADLVDDVLQEVMLVLWQQPSACPPTVPLVAWLCGIARHKAHKAVPRAAPPPGRPHPPLDRAVEDPVRVVLRQEDDRRLTQALDTLPYSERTAIRLLVQQGCSYQEIAVVMDTPVSTVRTRIWRARHHLHRRLASVERPPASPVLRRRSRREDDGPPCPHPYGGG